MSERDSPQWRDVPSAPGEEPLAPPAPAIASWPPPGALNGHGPAPAPGDSDVPTWTPLSAVIALLTAIVVGGVGGALVAIVIGALLGVDVASGSNLPPGLELTATAVQDIAFVGVAVLFAGLGGRRARPAQFGLRTTSPWTAAALVFVLYVSFLAVTLVWTTLLHDHTREKLLDTLGANKGGALLVCGALVTCVVAPFCEEFLFRGYIFTALRNWRGPWPAALLTGLLFGGVHALSAPAVDLVPLAFLGFGLCLLYWVTRSLLPGIAAHSINNSIAFAGLLDWPALDYLLLMAGALGVLGLVGWGMRRAGLIVAGAPAGLLQG